VIGCLFVMTGLAQAQVDKMIDDSFRRESPRIRSGDLRVLQLEIFPDPLREGSGSVSAQSSQMTPGVQGDQPHR